MNARTTLSPTSPKGEGEKLLRDAGIAFNPDEFRHVESRWREGLLVAEVARHEVPDGLALHAFGHGGPSRDLVELRGLDRLSAEAHVADALAHRLARRAGVREAAHAHHIAALLVIGIGIEQVVADVL